MDMGDHGVTSLGVPILKTEMVLDALLQEFSCPAEPIPHHALACRGPQIIAGEILAAPIRSVAQCGTQLRLRDWLQMPEGQGRTTDCWYYWRHHVPEHDKPLFKFDTSPLASLLSGGP